MNMKSVGAVVACELTALTADQRLRRAALAERLRAEVLEVTDLPSGYAFHLDQNAATAQGVEQLVALERVCCPFLTLATRIDSANDRLILEIGGGEGVREFIAAQFGIGRRLRSKEAS